MGIAALRAAVAPNAPVTAADAVAVATEATRRANPAPSDDPARASA